MSGFLASLNDGDVVPVLVVTLSSLVVFILLLLTCFKIRQRIKARAQTIDQEPAYDFPVPAPEENDETNVEKLFQPPPPKTDVASAHELVTADVHKCKSSSCAKCARRQGEYIAGDTTFVDVTSSSRSFWNRQLETVLPRINNNNKSSSSSNNNKSRKSGARSSKRASSAEDDMELETAIEVSVNETAQESPV